MDSIEAADSCVKSGRTWASRTAVRGEREREYEFYRYYGPFKRMTDYGPVYCDVRDARARAQHKAISCPDKILTTFCQLGALRMKARRALIFFFDINHAYIMAEATQTLSLEDNSTYEPGDQLWMGHSVIPRDVACCETTVNLPSFPAKANAKGDYRESIFVVNDLTKHPDLKDRPYVTGYPHGRFYAGVPITTPSGTNIGAYCILDDKPRDAISPQDIVFMRDMSQTVMTHLETTRALSERQQGNDMVAGLGRFIKGPSGTRSEASLATNMPLKDNDLCEDIQVHSGIPDALVDVIASPSLDSSYGGRREYFDQKSLSENQCHIPTPTRTAVPTLPDEVPVQPADVSKSSSEPLAKDTRTEPRRPRIPHEGLNPAAASQRKHAPRPSLRKRNSTTKGRSTYQRAAEILCQSLRIDGVAFLDASVGTFGGLAETTETSTGGESDDSASNFPDPAATEAKIEATKACKVLGCAQAIRSAESVVESAQPVKKLTEAFIRSLMRRHPNGRIWTFDEHFTTHAEDGSSTENENAPQDSPIESQSTASRLKRTARREQRSDGEHLQLAFPGARCIALHGIWDHARGRWSVGGLYWTYDPLRVLCMETEMRFVDTFCDVVVAEMKRNEVVQSDKAKSDFISSVSHELRSPLHGILGSVEILAEQTLCTTASTMVEQITSCGNTLLDIIDHLLDFADLKHRQLKKGAVRSSKIGHKSLPPVGGTSDNGLAALDTDIALDDLTEEIVASSVYSYHYTQGIEERPQTLVILDIERSFHAAWRCQLATGGWRRVCMNLITNALKYTPAGFIRISLKQKSRPGTRRRFDAILSVSDSGKGMSEEFQRNRLFRDFAQEDSLSHGLGIGMHMVSRMVHAMGGNIDVTSSQKGTGTRVTVTVPLERQRDHSKPAVEDSASPYQIFPGLEAGIIAGVHQHPQTRKDSLMTTAWAIALTSVEKDLVFLGFRAEKCLCKDRNLYDMIVVTELDLDARLQSIQHAINIHGRTNFPPMLVICSNIPTAHRRRQAWAKNSLSADLVAEYISLPCTVKQIARASSSALEQHKELMALTTRVKQPKDTPSATQVTMGDGLSYTDEPKDQTLVLRPARPSPVPGEVDVDQSKHGVLPSLPEDIQESVKQRPVPSVGMSRGQRNETSVLPETQAPGFSSRSDEPILSTSLASKRPVLLLVDDNNINLQLLKTFAKKRQYPHITAVDGQLAVDAFVDAHQASLTSCRLIAPSVPDTVPGVPNVILMDINMPVMDGYEAVQHIRIYEKRHHMVPSKIIAVTALDSEAAHAEAFGSGFNLFLSKPLKLKDLAKLIEGE